MPASGSSRSHHRDHVITIGLSLIERRGRCRDATSFREPVMVIVFF